MDTTIMNRKQAPVYFLSVNAVAAAVACISFLAVTVPSCYADKAHTENEKGIAAYEEKKFDESAGHFTEAVVERPDSPALKFNLGTALSEKNEPEEALKQLGTAAEDFSDPKQKAAAHYNAGNTRFLAGDLENAIGEYTRAVKYDQESKDIRFNLERAVRKLREQQQQQQDKDSDEEQKKDDKQKQEDEEKKSKTQDTDQQQQQDQEQQQTDQQESEDRQMSPEEAERILEALSDEEKKALSLRRMQMKQEMRQSDDW